MGAKEEGGSYSRCCLTQRQGHALQPLEGGEKLLSSHQNKGLSSGLGVTVQEVRKLIHFTPTAAQEGKRCDPI